MKGDFTRFSHQPDKHYAAVLMQQGRVQLDADWNEQHDIDEHRLRTQTIDTIGVCGVPEHTPGFEITFPVGGPDLHISPGRIYVDGILCELDLPEGTTLPYSDQDPWLPHPLPSPLSPVDGRTDLVYLDVWRRHVTVIEDPHLKEVALGGPDTATRLQTVFQVKVLEDVAMTDCEDQSDAWDNLAAPNPARMSARSAGVSAPDDPCLIAPGAGYRGIENRLYRIEIHEGGAFGTANFKWSRDNGALLTSVDAFIGGPQNQVQVASVGRDGVLRFQVGDRVEVLNDEKELSDGAGIMTAVANVDEAERILDLDDDVSSLSGGTRPRIRKWDQTTDPVLTQAPWHELEKGVQVGFSGGPFAPGDYWVVPARTAIGDVDGFIDSPPHGVKHHFCKLALVTWHVSDSTVTADIQDCRKRFPPLTELPPGGASCCSVSVGDGVSSRGDFTDIQEAIDSLGSEPAAVCVLPGTYRLDNPILIRRNDLVISGCGRRAVVQAPPTEPAVLIEGSQRVRLEGLTLLGTATEIVTIAQSHAIDVEDCRIANQGGDCVGFRDFAEDDTGDNPRDEQGFRFLVRQFDGNPAANSRIVQWGPTFRGLDCGFKLEIDLPQPSATADVTLVHFSAPARVEAFQDGTSVGTKSMSGPQQQEEKLSFSATAIDRLVVIAPGNEALLLEVCAGEGAGGSGTAVFSAQSGEVGLLDNHLSGRPAATVQSLGLRVTDNRMDGGGLWIREGTSDAWIRNNRVRDGAGPGIALGGLRQEEGPPSNAVGIERVVIAGNDIADMGGSGLTTVYEGKDDNALGDIDDLRVEHNRVSGCLKGEPDRRLEPMAAGGVVLRGVSRALIRDNYVVGNGAEGRWPACGIFVAFSRGLHVDGNHVIGNGMRPESSEAPADLYQGGIVVFAALPHSGGLDATKETVEYSASGTPTFGTHSALISDNIVITPAGHSLFLAGIGAMLVADNSLTSLGTADQPFALARNSRTVFVFNLGRVPLLSETHLVTTHATVHSSPMVVGNAVTVGSHATLGYLPDGRVSFNGNQVTMRDPGQEGLGAGAAAMLSYDDIGITDNQFFSVLSQGAIAANVWAIAPTVRADGNRFTEVPTRALFSFVCQGTMGIATSNQSTHCILVGSGNPIKDSNHEIINAHCKPLTEAMTGPGG